MLGVPDHWRQTRMVLPATCSVWREELRMYLLRRKAVAVGYLDEAAGHTGRPRFCNRARLALPIRDDPRGVQRSTITSAHPA